MKPIPIILALVLGLACGWFAGTFSTWRLARVHVRSGPYSDGLQPARDDLAQASRKLRTGDTNVADHINAADAQLKRAQDWTRQFLGERSEPHAH